MPSPHSFSALQYARRFTFVLVQWAYWLQRTDERLADPPPKNNKEPLTVKHRDGRPRLEDPRSTSWWCTASVDAVAANCWEVCIRLHVVGRSMERDFEFLSALSYLYFHGMIQHIVLKVPCWDKARTDPDYNPDHRITMHEHFY